MEDLAEKKKIEEDRDGQSQDDVLAFNLYKNTMTGKWGNIVKMYKEQKFSAINARINSSGDTAFHVAVSIAPEETVLQLIRVITIHSESSLLLTNDEGKNTPLHVAASAGRLNICILLAKVYYKFSEVPNLETHQDPFRNKLGETPLFLAAFHGYKSIFLYLHYLLLGASDKDLDSVNPAYRRNDGETVLHCAIRWEYFDLAFEILQKQPNLVFVVNELGITPLHLLASKPSVFESGCNLGWWKKIIYYSIYVEELKQETASEELINCVIKELNESSKTNDENTHKFPKKYLTGIEFYQVWQTMAQFVSKWRNMHSKSRDEDVESHSEQIQQNVPGQSKQEGLHSQSPSDELHFFGRCYNNIHKLVFSTILYIRVILGLVVLPLVPRISKIKRKHVHSFKIMKMLIAIIKKKYPYINFSNGRNPRPTSEPEARELNDVVSSETITTFKPDQQETNEGGKSFSKKKKKAGKKETSKIENMEKTETPILLATRYGITEMVTEIFKDIPTAISDKSEGNNIVLSAAKNRQPQVLKLLLNREIVRRKLINEVDMKENNNALHLAANLGKQKPWLITGAALQMQWEIKWYKFVRRNVPQHFYYQLNHNGKTPEEIFDETHEKLVEEGGKWLNKTSESCSVVAALIATVAFAASTTIPGELNQTSGTPELEKHLGLTIFAYSSLFALFFSITSLFSFLSILTARYQQKDFSFKLPLSLLFALTMLFVSIISMLVSFCAGHSFMLGKRLKHNTFTVYALLTCIPIVCFAIQQLPLYFDYLWAIWSKVPRSRNKKISL